MTSADAAMAWVQAAKNEAGGADTTVAAARAAMGVSTSGFLFYKICLNSR